MNKHLFFDYLFSGFNPKEYIKTHKIYSLFDINENDLTNALKKQKKDIYSSVDPTNATPFPVELDDISRLHYLVTSRKVTTVMEFGVGKSTTALAHALSKNKDKHAKFVSENLRRSNPFELHSIDSMQEWITTCEGSLPPDLKTYVQIHHCPLEISDFQGRLCTYYKNIPNICPDFIYIDAPDQFSAQGNIRGLTTAHPDRMPMIADILTIEHFLQPGTLILIDGRAANARFLKANLQRNWRYIYIEEFDQHFFELHEPPLGRINKAMLEYCLPAAFFENACIK